MADCTLQVRHCARCLMVLALVAGLCPAWLGGQTAQPQAPTEKELSVQEYIAALGAASETIDRGIDGGDPAAMHNLRMSLPAKWEVNADGQRMEVGTDWLATALLSSEAHTSEGAELLLGARQRLDALREDAEGFLAPAQGPTLGESRAQLQRILKDRDYRGSRGPSWLDVWKQRIYQWISDHLDKIFSRVGVSTTVGSAIAWMLVACAAILMATWTVRSLLAVVSRSDMDLRGAAAAGQDWRYWAGRARAMAARGDYRSAIHAAYWAGVARLEEKQVLSRDRSRTPRESLRMVKQQDARAPLAGLTRRLELSWYGYRAATPADWDDAVKQLEALECLYSSTGATSGS